MYFLTVGEVIQIWRSWAGGGGRPLIRGTLDLMSHTVLALAQKLWFGNEEIYNNVFSVLAVLLNK